MDTSEIAAWCTVLALSMMLVGGLVLWAYGGGRNHFAIETAGPEAEATQRFHNHLARWFFIYGVTIVVGGVLLLAWAVSQLV